MQYFLSKLEENGCLDEHKLYALAKRRGELPVCKDMSDAEFLCYKNGSVSHVTFIGGAIKKVLFSFKKSELKSMHFRPDFLALGLSWLVILKSKKGAKIILEVVGKENRCACKGIVEKLKRQKFVKLNPKKLN